MCNSSTASAESTPEPYTSDFGTSSSSVAGAIVLIEKTKFVASKLILDITVETIVSHPAGTLYNHLQIAVICSLYAYLLKVASFVNNKTVFVYKSVVYACLWINIPTFAYN